MNRFLILLIFCSLGATQAFAALHPGHQTDEDVEGAFCDTIVLASGLELYATIQEETGEEILLTECGTERNVRVRRSSVREIRYANGERRSYSLRKYRDRAPASEEEKERRSYRKLLGWGIGLLIAAFVLALPTLYLAIGVAFGGAEGLAIWILFIPVILFMIGLIKLIQGLVQRKRYKDRYYRET